MNTTTSSRGTNGYQAPELLLSPNDPEETSYNNKADIWAMECILFELVFSRKAFSTDWDVVSGAQSKPLPLPSANMVDEGWQPEIERLLQRMLAFAPHDRDRSVDLCRAFAINSELVPPSKSNSKFSRYSYAHSKLYHDFNSLVPEWRHPRRPSTQTGSSCCVFPSKAQSHHSLGVVCGEKGVFIRHILDEKLDGFCHTAVGKGAKGRKLVAAALPSEGATFIWDLETGRKLLSCEGKMVTSIAFHVRISWYSEKRGERLSSSGSIMMNRK